MDPKQGVQKREDLVQVDLTLLVDQRQGLIQLEQLLALRLELILVRVITLELVELLVLQGLVKALAAIMLALVLPKQLVATQQAILRQLAMVELQVEPVIEMLVLVVQALNFQLLSYIDQLSKIGQLTPLLTMLLVLLCICQLELKHLATSLKEFSRTKAI